MDISVKQLCKAPFKLSSDLSKFPPPPNKTNKTDYAAEYILHKTTENEIRSSMTAQQTLSINLNNLHSFILYI